MFRDFQMTRRDIRHMIQAVLLNWLLLILIALMIASVFSVLLIKGGLLKERLVHIEPSQGLVACCVQTAFTAEAARNWASAQSRRPASANAAPFKIASSLRMMKIGISASQADRRPFASKAARNRSAFSRRSILRGMAPQK